VQPAQKGCVFALPSLHPLTAVFRPTTSRAHFHRALPHPSPFQYLYIKEEEETALRDTIANLERSVSELEELKACSERETSTLRTVLAETKALLEACTARAVAAEAELATTVGALHRTKVSFHSPFAPPSSLRANLR